MSKMEAEFNLMISPRPSMGLEVRRDFVKRANAVSKFQRGCCQLLSCMRRSPNDRRQGGNE